ncbi:MAG: substrate-binding domain-containing protein [Candidatus Hodarchaeota archaeon]
MNNSKWTVLALITTILVTIGASLVTWQLLFANEDAQVNIRLATTTSTENSGLLDYLLPEFYRTSNVRVSVIAVGTGAALDMGERGDADCVIIHAREKEDAFIAAGWGVHRVDLMYNDFVIIGPESDPANITSLSNATEAFNRIREEEAHWVSRGDNSGTHFKELSIWAAIGFIPDTENQTWVDLNSWYEETGQGMGNTLMIADQKEAYVLADRGTWIFQRDALPQLSLLVEGSLILYNPYGAILINPEKHPHVKYQAAKEFIRWLISEDGQALIDSYKIDDEQLFFSDFLNHINEMSESEKAFWGIDTS